MDWHDEDDPPEELTWEGAWWGAANRAAEQLMWFLRLFGLLGRK